MMCDVCCRVLEDRQTMTTDGVAGPFYDHDPQDRPADHAPVPVPVDPKRIRARCDFCNDEVELAVAWVVPCADFPVVELPDTDHWSRGDWEACATCAFLVRTGDWTKVIDRMAGGYRRHSGKQELDPLLRLQMTMMAAGVQKNMTGPPYKEVVA